MGNHVSYPERFLMSVTTFSPAGMFQPVPYHHVAVGTGSRHVHVAGQIARDGEGTRIATDDLAGQVSQVLRNTARGLAAAGASFDDVVRLRFFVTPAARDDMEAFMAGVAAVAAEVGLPSPMPPASLIGVDFLFEPDVLVELEAEAIVD
jgi:enamine deaminase RidA (YjgF/YER057c/UK114 family)